MTALIRLLVERSLVVHLITVFVLALGVVTMFKVDREAFPNVNMDRIDVNVIYTGATPEEVEKLIVTPIEQEIKAITGIEKMNSIAFPGSARIQLELDPDATNRHRIVTEVQLAVDRAQLPQDLPYDPIVTEIEGGMFPVIQLAVSADRSPLEIQKLGDKIVDDVLLVDGVARVIVQGKRRMQLRVIPDMAKLNQHRVSVGQIAELLRAWNINAPAGEIDTGEGQKSVRIVGEFSNTKDVADLVLRSNVDGGALRLGDIAKVVDDLEEPRVYYDVAGVPALSMIILKKTDADIIETVDKLKEYLKTAPQQYGGDVHIDTFQDFSRFTRLRLNVLTGNAAQGLVLVFISLILFLRPSVAITTTWGLPVVFLSGLFVLHAMGVTLNLISMLGFIIVLGMLVDDAIVVGENITYHMERGMAPREAAVVGTVELIGPVATSVLTTIAAFIPMFFVSGIMGKFIVAIPTVVILLLCLSLAEAFFLMPGHVASFANAKAHPKERRWLAWVEARYVTLLTFALRWKWSTIFLSIALLISTLFIAKMSAFELFPSAGLDQYVVRVTAPPGISLAQMREKLREVDREIRKRIDPKNLETTIISTGQIAMDEGDPLTQRGSRFGQIRVIYTPAVVRPGHNALDDMHRISKEVTALFSNYQVVFTEVKPGPPVGRALQVEISGNDAAASAEAARQLVDYLGNIKGIMSVESDLQPGDEELRIVVDRKLAAYAGVNLDTVAAHVRATVEGLRVTTARHGTQEIDITIRFPQGDDQRAMIRAIQIPSQRGGLVPLSEIARLEPHRGDSTIRHREGLRTVSVAANVDVSQITSFELNKKVREDQEKWTQNLAHPVNIVYGGENEKNQESVRDLAISFLFAMIGIFFLLAIQFNNIIYPIVVMLAIPFGVIGIVISFYLHSQFWQPMPLSFFALLGMVALSGVVVNSSLLLLVFVQRALQDGVHYMDAIIQAGRRRLRAILLTSATTVFGLLPTAYGWGGMDPFVSPMALALSWGLVVATAVTLVTIPAVFAAGVTTKEKVLRLFSRKH